jgi:Tfp pilus assembly protein PilN
MGNVITNSNATVSDYIRALDQVSKTVEAKYGATMGD